MSFLFLQRPYGNSEILIRMIVELFNGFCSIDFSHNVKMYQRNKIYHETKSVVCAYNMFC